MKQNKSIIIITAIILFLLFSSLAFASQNANIVYIETDMGYGTWQYDYIFFNTSTSNESLYNVWFDFAQVSSVTGSLLPTGWDGTKWEGTNNTAYLDTFSTDATYDISAGSSLSGFRFAINYRAGSIPYTAYFDSIGGNTFTTGVTGIIPEPISSILFIIGGATLGLRRFRRRKHA